MGNIGTGLVIIREALNSNRCGAINIRDVFPAFGIACAVFVRFRVAFFLEIADLVVVDCFFLRTLVAAVLAVFLLIALLAVISTSIPA